MASYYSVDAILTDAQKVPCKFELDVPGLGFIDGSVGADVRINQYTMLPYLIPPIPSLPSYYIQP